MEAIEKEHLTKEEATQFFSELYGGEHHIPNYKLHEFGYGWMVKDYTMGWATFDYSVLTRFVLMCHDKCIRGEIRPHTFKEMKIIIHKRQNRDGKFTERHPTIETAIESFNKK